MKILSFDGGGLRSLFSARIVQRTLMSTPNLLDKTDLIAGTSGGAIVAAALAFGLAPSDIVQFFRERGKEIFTPSDMWDEIGDLWNMTGAKYTNSGLKKVLTSVFGTTTLGQLRKKVAIAAYDLRGAGRAKPMVFHNFDSYDANLDLAVVDAVMRSTAAPLYFPVYQKFGDGGMFANHPGMKALALAVNPFVGKETLRQVALLSLGTGRTGLYLKTAKNDLGAMDWVKNEVFNFLVDGSSDSIDDDLRSILGPQYHRVQVEIPDTIAMDDLSKMSTMQDLADVYDGTDLRAWLQGFWLY